MDRPGHVSGVCFCDSPAVTLLGGQQTARTIHFFLSILLLLFLLVHVVMVFLAGFRNRMRAMITGRVDKIRNAHERFLTT